MRARLRPEPASANAPPKAPVVPGGFFHSAAEPRLNVIDGELGFVEHLRAIDAPVFVPLEDVPPIRHLRSG